MTQLASVTTDGLPQGSEFNQAWKKILSTYVARDPDDAALSGIRFQPGDGGNFKGCIEYGNLGAAGICRVRSSSNRYLRQPAPRFDSDAPAMLVLQTKGISSFQQDQRRICLAPGDWNIYDTTRPFSITSDGDSEHLVFLHRHAESRRVLQLLADMPRRSFGSNGIERAARDLMLVTFRECGRMSCRSGEVAAEALLRMMHAAIEEAAETQAAPVQSLRDQIIAFIDARVADDDLAVGTIATAFGYSTRQIHRMFQDQTGMTVSEYIWKARLAHVLQDLRSAASRDKTITEIAFTWGFSNAAHFSRTFKEAYGMTPTQCRNASA
jgi:AraC-like DNA-binding protein